MYCHIGHKELVQIDISGIDNLQNYNTHTALIDYLVYGFFNIFEKGIYRYENIYSLMKIQR